MFTVPYTSTREFTVRTAELKSTVAPLFTVSLFTSTSPLRIPVEFLKTRSPLEL